MRRRPARRPALRPRPARTGAPAATTALRARSLLAVLVLAAGACGGGDGPAARGPAGGTAALSPDVKVQVDSGNAAYRDRDFDAALRHFREAARLDPDQAVAWYGVQMAASAAGERAAADSAAARLRALAPSAPPAVHHPGTPRPATPPRTTAT